jgi:hypothetical protein
MVVPKLVNYAEMVFLMVYTEILLKIQVLLHRFGLCVYLGSVTGIKERSYCFAILELRIISIKYLK